MAKVTLHTDDDVGVLSLTNPPLNLWDKGLLADWKSAIDQAARTPKRALVVRAEGSIFSGGTDVSVFRDVSSIEGRESSKSIFPFESSKLFRSQPSLQCRGCASQQEWSSFSPAI